MSTTLRARTPLEQFLQVVRLGPEFGNFTEQGLSSFQRSIATALPFLPRIIARGEWIDWTDNAPAEAIAALVAAEAPPDPEDVRELGCLDTREQDATYIVGLLSGLALAHALMGATDLRHE